MEKQIKEIRNLNTMVIILVMLVFAIFMTAQCYLIIGSGLKNKISLSFGVI
jgi:hypothetical protein